VAFPVFSSARYDSDQSRRFETRLTAWIYLAIVYRVITD
jgi:hypothetical protein